VDTNKSSKLILSDVYLYDISSCHYRILESTGFDVSHIDKDDKLKRNTQIGLIIRTNPRIGTLLRNITNSTISDFLARNSVTENELILRAYDGFIVTRKLEIMDANLPIEYRRNYYILIFSSDRQRYLATDMSGVSIKGVPHRYEEMDKILTQVAQLNFVNKTLLFKGLQRIKDSIIYGEDPNLYCIPVGDRKYNIFFKAYGQTEISESLIKILDTDDIDREKYFDFYIRPFAESIVLEYG
jgi:hypothetical protein